MKKVKKISARLQKKLSGKAELPIKQETIDISEPSVEKPKIEALEVQSLSMATILDLAKERSPAAFENINDKQALGIVENILQTLNTQINEIDSGILALPKFGRFVIRQSTGLKDGQPHINRRVFCHLIKIKES